VEELKQLTETLAVHEKNHDIDGLRSVREQIARDYPESPEAVEAHYKLGLDALFHKRDLAIAVQYFEQAVKGKQAFWAQAARTSLGLCYYHQKRTQKALFELRKVGYSDPPTAHSITALSFIEHIYGQAGEKEEVQRVRKDRISQLETVIEACKHSHQHAERGYHMYTLGLALLDQGDDVEAKIVLEDTKNLGPDLLGAELYKSVVEALKN